MPTLTDASDDLIAEFRAAVGELFSTPERREIELLRSRVILAKPRSHSRVILQKELCEKLAAQIMREVA